MTKTIWKIFVSLALVILLLLVAAEFGVRWIVSDQLKKDYQQSSVEPKISFGPTPLLLSQITGVVPSVRIQAPSSISIADGPTIKGAPASDVKITDLNIRDQNNPVAGHLDVSTALPEDFLLAQAQASMNDQRGRTGGNELQQMITGMIKITGLDTLQNEQAVKVEFTDGAATLKLKPEVKDGQLKFRAEDASLFGFNLPGQVTETLTKSLEKQSADIAGGLHVKQLDVEDTQITLTLAGDNVPLNELQQESAAQH